MPRPPKTSSQHDLAHGAALAQLQQREQDLATAEIELALADAGLRGREATVSAQRSGLEHRARWIDQRVRQLQSWAAAAGVDAAEELVGLGDGAALREADVEAYVDRSKTLLVSRAATLAAREEMLEVRRCQIEGREAEVEALEQAFIRAEVRLTARERLLVAATGSLEQMAAQPQADAETAAAVPAVLLKTPSHIRHAPTVTMTAAEASEQGDDDLIQSRTVAGKPAPPVLELGMHSRRASGARRGAAVEVLPRLTLADRALHKGQVELDRDGRIILVSLSSEDRLPPEVDFVYFGADGEVSHLEVKLKLLMPTAGGRGSAAVLSAAAWSDHDFDLFEKRLASLSA